MLPGSSETVTVRRDLSDADAADLWEKLPDRFKADIGARALAAGLASEAVEQHGSRPDRVGEIFAAVVHMHAAVKAALDWLRRGGDA